MQHLESLLLELKKVYFSFSDIFSRDCVFFKETVAILVDLW